MFVGITVLYISVIHISFRGMAAGVRLLRFALPLLQRIASVLNMEQDKGSFREAKDTNACCICEAAADAGPR